MEVDEQVMTGSTLQQVDAIVHVHLVVAREEVDLHTSHTDLFAPGKLALAVFGLVQTVFGPWGTIYPAHGRVIPDHRFDTLRLGIGNGILNSLTILHLVPFGIDEHIGQMKGCSHIHIFPDNRIVVGAMIVSPVDPGYHTWLYPTRIGKLTRFTDIGNQRRSHHISHTADDDGAPGTVPGKATGRRVSGNAVDRQLVLIRCNLEQFTIIIQTRGTLTALDISL